MSTEMAETEEAKVVSTVADKVKDEEGDGMESRIERSMRSRVSYFKEQADSLTFEGVRRLLEKDMGLDSYALDVHKRFVKECLLKCLNKDDDANGSESSAKIEEKDVAEGEGAEAPIKELSNDVVKEASSENEEKMDDSPVMGLLTGKKTTEVQAKKVESIEKKEAPSQSTIKGAIRKRASYLKANSETITMAGVRRILEEDLQLDKNTLLPFKKFITEQVDEVLKMPAVAASSGKKKTSNKSSQSKASKKINTKDSSDSPTSGSEEMEDEVRSKSKVASKRKASPSEELRKVKRPAKEAKVSSKKQSKVAEKSDESSGSEARGSASEDDQSQSSTEKAVKKAQKKEVATPTYGKRVEHLKSIIRSCGMSIPPAAYKRAKQVSENKREATLIKELEDILSREGLSADPSEKEIKEVKKRKDRAKELEGIDMSNIVSSTRRRSTASFAPPPKPKVPVKSDAEDAEDTGSSSSNGDDDEDDEDGSDSPSEELNQDDDENSD